METEKRTEISGAVKEKKRWRFLDSIRQAIFVVGTGTIIFIAFRNSIAWHAQKFWGASGNFWQSGWSAIYNYCVYLTCFVSNGSFWVYNYLFLLLDLLQWPTFLMKYRVQDDTKLDYRKFAKALVRVLFNQYVMGLPIAYCMYRAMKWRGCSFGEELPDFPIVIWELFVCVWIEEIGFYYTHRLLHHPKFYKHVHKIHHEWTAPIGIIGLYAHPVEMILSNMLPLLTGPLICGSHAATAILWYCMAAFSITIAHCGYHLPFMPSPEAHDFHHLKFTNNFGTLGVLDRLHGTDANFRQTKAHERHILLLSLVPLKVSMPDDEKVKVT